MTEDGGQIDEEDVRHVASLARVDVSDDEVERFVEQFEDVLGYYEKLADVPSIDENPELDNVMWPDKEESCLAREEATQNAQTEDGFFEAPSVAKED